MPDTVTDGLGEAVGEALPEAVGVGDGDAVPAEGLGSADAEGEWDGERGTTGGTEAGAFTEAGGRMVAAGMLSLTS
ncbi:hypothetical protein ACIGXF_02970 [Streptomyces sp. NPDC053086]|uniref:hypothetical protein n=1 Tax=unclassified Streptomyces TaxID=2593676 RepID=UPI0037D96FC1